MKQILKKILKILLIFIISTTIIYLIYTANAFYKWCDKNSLLSIFNPFYSATENLSMVDVNKIKEIGNYVGAIETGMNKSLENSPYINDGINHYVGDGHNHTTIAEFFDPAGYSVWIYIYGGLRSVFTGYIKISILLGAILTTSYIVIRTQKLNTIFKIILGYLLPMIIVPPLYMYSYTYRFWDIYTTYFKEISKYFYIIYTIIFVSLYVINYIITVKRAKELNKAIKLSEE